MPNFTTCNSKIIKFFTDRWYAKADIIAWILIPFSMLYCLVSMLRRYLYQCGIKKIYRFEVPVIVVGNITVGGSGKSPLVVYLARHFTERGYRVGIVARGYKGKASVWPQSVNADSDPTQVGDEAVMLAQQTQVPVVVDPDRVAAVHFALQNFKCNLILSDDGLQHYALGRDIEIAVLDGQHRLGNGFCLPAGPLRESARVLERVDFVVVNGGPAQAGEYSFQLKPLEIYNLAEPSQKWPLPLAQSARIHAIAGIGFPQRFFDSLQALGFEPIPHAFPDHYEFSRHDIDYADFPIIMTAKDAVKCQSFADQRHWCLVVNAEVDQSLLDALAARL